MSVLPQRVQPYFYRTSGGAEIDLVLEFGVNERWAIEIKRSSALSVSKGFHVACDDIKASKKYVVYAGKDGFSLGNNVHAISLFDLMNTLIESQNS